MAREFEDLVAAYPTARALQTAYQAFWEKLARPGSWWTGAERIALANEVRRAVDCQICAERKGALSPGLSVAPHRATADLSAAAVDAVHRVITDPARITRDYLDHTGLSDEEYVELVGIVVCLFSIDESLRALGVQLEPLPTAVAGEPTGYRPVVVKRDVGLVPMIPREGAVGAESDLWSVGRAANVMRALSLVPDAVRDWYALADVQYLSIAQMRSFSGPTGKGLDRRQMELVAGRVSALNECFY